MPVLPLLEALVVVGLWSASPILVKSALVHLSPTQVAGTRYFGAFLAVLPLLLTRSRPWLRRLTRKEWLRLAAMGIVSYAIGNSLLFWGLEALSPTTTSFLLNALPLMTIALGVPWLGERPNRWQGVGVVVSLAGGLIFFGSGPELRHGWHILGTLAGTFCLAVFGVMNREFARSRGVDVAGLAAVPLFFGGGVLMLATPPPIGELAEVVGIILWLALMNSALAYLLWNHALKRLKAFEISIVGNLMPIGTALLSPSMVGESLPANSWLGMGLAMVGVVLVAWTSGRTPPPPITMEAVVAEPEGRGASEPSSEG